MTTDDLGSPRKATRQRLTSDKRRDKIVEAAREVFVKRGLAGARTRDIAEEAGVNEALLYRHFRSKEELFEAAVVAPLEEATSWLEQVLPGPEDESLSAETVHQRMRQHILNSIRAMDEIAPCWASCCSPMKSRPAPSTRNESRPTSPNCSTSLS